MYIHIFPMGPNKRSGYKKKFFFCEMKFFTISKQKKINSDFFNKKLVALRNIYSFFKHFFTPQKNSAEKGKNMFTTSSSCL